MATGKLSPRQKMINMMYLVLTALLALNVSKEILDAFVTVNNGLETTKLTLKEKVDDMYTTFEGYASENEAKYGAAWTAAKGIKDDAASLVSYLDQLKARAIAETEYDGDLTKVIGKDSQGRDTVLNLKLVNKKDNYDIITNLMVGSEPKSPKEGEFTAADLRQKLEAFREKIKASVGDKNPTLTANVDHMFNYPRAKEAGDTGPMTNWESINFYHVPLAACVTIMSKLQTDVRNAENETVNFLMADVEGKSLKFSALTTVVNPLSNYVTVGDSFRADVFMAAYDPKNVPIVELAGEGATVDSAKMEITGNKINVPIGADGKAKLRMPAQGVGTKTWKGIITFKPVGGEPIKQMFTAEYEVAQPNLVVSPTKMNVFYRGIDNPVDISVPGFSSDKIQPSMTNGSLKKAAQGWTVQPGKDTKSMVSVSVTMPDGRKKSLPGLEFRVKNVPDPKPQFAGKGLGDNTVKKSEIMAAQGVIAKMVDFEFDLKFEVIEFSVVGVINGETKEKTVRGNKITDEQRQLLERVKPGQRIWIEGIKAKGPDGSVRALGTLALKVT